jgi:AcrR family transcriptional regulator
MPRILTPSDVAQFRSRLCDVAAGLFSEQGQSGFNMRELAKRLGVSAMTPYRYFQDKDAILAEVRARAFARFADYLEDALATKEDDRTTLANSYAQFAIQEQTQYRLMFDLAQPAVASSPLLASQERRARAAIVSHARHMVERGVLAGDPELLGLLLWSALHGATALYLTRKLSEEDFHLVLSNTIRLVADGRVRAACEIDDLAPDAPGFGASNWVTPKSYQPVAVAGE